MKGARRIVIRIIKIVSPPETTLSRWENFVPLPTEGSLATVHGSETGMVNTWSTNVNSTHHDSPLRHMYMSR